VVAEYRVDPQTGDWRIVAPGRSRRPVDTSAAGAVRCPFCPGNESMTPPEVLRLPAGGADWRVRVVPNRFGIVTAADGSAGHDGSGTSAGHDGSGTSAGHDGSGTSAGHDGALRATGAHEVVVESARHDWDLRFATTDEAAEVLTAMRERCRALTGRGSAAVVVFRNHGVTAGSSLRHPHSQIVALDQAPPGLSDRWHRARQFVVATGRRLHDDVAAAERADGRRVVADADGVLVYQPRAAGRPHETVLLPDDASADLAGASDEALAAVARTLPRVLRGLAGVRDDPDYNLVVHAGPAGDDGARDWYRWHVGLYPRVTKRAGLEIATGLSVNPTAPEETAAALRAAMAAPARP
jgi:UDPglucose--hexose-1-phosphate uridylyltransferase